MNHEQQQKIAETAKTVIKRFFMRMQIKDLVKENIALMRLVNLDNISIHDYIQLANKLGFKELDINAVVQDAEDMIEEIKQESDFNTIAKSCYCERLCDVFNDYFNSYNFEKYADNGEYDENDVPKNYPQTIKGFIQAAYFTFERIRYTVESFDLVDLIKSEPINMPRKELTEIFISILMGKIRRGRNITSIIGKHNIFPESFKRLCRIKNGQYIIFNTDWTTLDFQIAVFDLIEFVDYENKKLFNNKVNQYLKITKMINVA